MGSESGSTGNGAYEVGAGGSVGCGVRLVRAADAFVSLVNRSSWRHSVGVGIVADMRWDFEFAIALAMIARRTSGRVAHCTPEDEEEEEEDEEEEEEEEEEDNEIP